MLHTYELRSVCGGRCAMHYLHSKHVVSNFRESKARDILHKIYDIRYICIRYIVLIKYKTITYNILCFPWGGQNASSLHSAIAPKLTQKQLHQTLHNPRIDSTRNAENDVGNIKLRTIFGNFVFRNIEWRYTSSFIHYQTMLESR